MIGALALSAPAFVVLAVFVDLGDVRVRAAFLAALAIYLGILIVLRPLVIGIAKVQRAIDALAAGGAPSEINAWSPSVRALWIALSRFLRVSRQAAAAREGELGAAQAVLAALPDPLILLDERRRIFRANAAATELLGMRLVDRDLAVALRHPAVLAAAEAVLRGEGGRIVEFEV